MARATITLSLLFLFFSVWHRVSSQMPPMFPMGPPPPFPMGPPMWQPHMPPPSPDHSPSMHQNVSAEISHLQDRLQHANSSAETNSIRNTVKSLINKAKAYYNDHPPPSDTN